MDFPSHPPLVQLRPRPGTLYVSQGRSVLASRPDGFVTDGSEKGLFVHETRLLSRYRYLIDGEVLQPVALSGIEQHTWLGYYIQVLPGIEVGGGSQRSGMMDPATKQTLELRLARHLGRGMQEDVKLTNFTQKPTSFQLALEIDADFADIKETGAAGRRQEGERTREWRQQVEGVWELAFDYRAEHAYEHQGEEEEGTARLHRGATLRVEEAASPPFLEGDRVVFGVTLPPRGTWGARLRLCPQVDGDVWEPVAIGPALGSQESDYDEKRQRFLGAATTFEAPGSETLTAGVLTTLAQARRDLAALRLYDLDAGEAAGDAPGGWVPAAGLPIYVALFGRDTLTAAWQAGLLGPELMQGTLEELARWQGAETNDWRDEEPGRMLHEAHTGPLKELNYNPNARSYNSQTTAAFYPVAASELWHWTGEMERVRPFVEPARKALAWLDEHGDLDGDGFYEYQTRSKQGPKNQAWKDSDDAIVHTDGSQVQTPIATCEEQAFVYLAKLHFAEVLWQVGEKKEAKQRFGEARALKERFNEVFWMEDKGFYAMGLDADKRPIRSIGSNPGHCLACGIAGKDRARQTAARLFSGDLFSGWGVRTLSTEHPSYNPYSYHRGSVWPVEHGTFALGLMRYGLHAKAARLCRAQFEAAALFEHRRLPEVFSGHARTAEQPFPALYPQTNSPQAWSASAPLLMVQAMLGLYPYAPLKMLVVDPHLPAWLPEITLRGLRVGEARAQVRFYRKPGGTSSYEVQAKEGAALHVVRQPSPWSLTASYGERLQDALASLMPGK